MDHQPKFVEDEESEPLLITSKSVPSYKRLSCIACATGVIWSTLATLFCICIFVIFTFTIRRRHHTLPKDPMAAAEMILQSYPVFDGHIDLPILARALYANNVSAWDLAQTMPGQVDIPRLREGQVGGFFWSVYVECREASGPDFINATWLVRDTLEQIDVSRLLIDKYSNTFQWAPSSQEMRFAMSQGKIASVLGVEGAHQIGNSIAVVRQLYSLGVRYMTLTHACHNAFADSAGMLTPIPPLHGGLSSLGYKLIDEMNRLGMLVDLSHTSDAAAIQAFNYSQAPVIWSHSSARSVHNVSRNVPDNILEMIGKGTKDAVVMVNFFPSFVAPEGEANVSWVADHVEHMASIAGKSHVGIGSDFDGIPDAPKGLEDVSKYPALFAELYKRGWSQADLAGLSNGNLLRVLEGAESVARNLQATHSVPVMDLYEKRPDLPMKFPPEAQIVS